MAGSPIQLSAGAALGTSPPTPTFGGGATDTYGQVNFGSGTSPAAGLLFNLLSGVAWNGVGVTPQTGIFVGITPMNAATAALGPFYVIPDAAGRTLAVYSTNAPAASQAASTYRLAYAVTG